MHKKIFHYIILIILIIPLELTAQRTVGLFLNDTALSFKGYTLFAPNKYTSTYLINNDGRLCHKWSNSTYSPANSVYLLPNGHLLRTCKVQGYLNEDGGRVEEYSWGDTLIWYFNYSTQTYTTHHDVKALPNGNILMIACEKKTISQLVAAGFDTTRLGNDVKTLGYLAADYIIEVQPTYPSGGTIVWQWHVWDHLIQHYDSTKQNYGVISNHPELIWTNIDGTHSVPASWNHSNGIHYNAKFDQIILSVRTYSEVWVIDHSTTTEQAAGHTGGRYGKGGDLLYRWGNPICYQLGNAGNQKLFMQHDAEWIDTLCPGFGNITVFNNGVGRNYSSADEFVPPVDSLGFYFRASGMPFGPSGLIWSYTATPPTSFYCENISGAHRLQNGNTLITGGTTGTFFEVTSNGQIVWKYVNPVINSGPLYWNDSIPVDPSHQGTYQNLVFRVHRYAPAYSAFIGKDLTPGPLIELYPTGIEVENSGLPNSFELFQNYPNPFNPSTNIKYNLPKSCFVKIVILDVIGREVETLVNEKQSAGSFSLDWNASNYSSGVYFYRLITDNFIETKKMLMIK